MLRNFVQSGISESVLCRLSWWHSWAFFIVEWSVVVLKMFCNFKTINPTIRSLVISEKICLILITLQFWDMIKKGQEEINSSWLNRVLSDIEIPLEGFSESRTKFVRYFGHPLKPREATVRSEVVFFIIFAAWKCWRKSLIELYLETAKGKCTIDRPLPFLNLFFLKILKN